MVINDTTNRLGLIQYIEDKTITSNASSGSYPLRSLVRDTNLSLDDYNILMTESSGTWLGDDTNQTTFPIATTNIVSGQQSYVFTIDEQQNQILDIYRIECKDANGTWQLLTPYNEMDEETSLSAQETITGTPTRYAKTANGILLDKIPNYNSTDGLKFYFSRTPVYFTVDGSDNVTPTVPGIPNPHHRYLAVKPIYWFWADKDTSKASYWLNEVNKLEISIKEYFSQRTKDEKPRLTIKQVSNK